MSPGQANSHSPMLGFIAALMAHALLMLMTACGKLAVAFHNPTEMTFYRCLISVLACIVLMAWNGDWKHIIPVDSAKLVAGRSILGTINIVLLFQAYTLLPLADATALSFTASLITPVLAMWFLKEKISRSRWIAIGMGFIGVVIMAAPAGNIPGKGALLGLAVMAAWVILNATNAIILRKVSRVEHPITILLWLFMVGLIGTGLLMPSVANPLTPYSAFLLITAGICGFGGQWLYTMSFKFAEASTVAVLNYSAIVWATLYGFILFHDVPDWQLLIGAAIVIGVNIWLFFVQSAQARRAAIVAEIKEPPSV